MSQLSGDVFLLDFEDGKEVERMVLQRGHDIVGLRGDYLH